MFLIWEIGGAYYRYKIGTTDIQSGMLIFMVILRKQKYMTAETKIHDPGKRRTARRKAEGNLKNHHHRGPGKEGQASEYEGE